MKLHVIFVLLISALVYFSLDRMNRQIPVHLRSDDEVLITGATGDLGSALTKLFLTETQAQLVLLCNTRCDINYGHKYNQRMKVYKVDLSDSLTVESKINEIFHANNKIKVVVNNAALSEIKTFGDNGDLGKCFKIMDVNFRASLVIVKAFLESGRRSGQIININSVLSMGEGSFVACYASSKAALRNFHISLRREMRLKNSNITMLIAYPYLFNSKMFIKVTPPENPMFLGILGSHKTGDVALQIFSAFKRGDHEVYCPFYWRYFSMIYNLVPHWIKDLIFDYIMAEYFKNYGINAIKK